MAAIPGADRYDSLVGVFGSIGTAQDDCGVKIHIERRVRRPRLNTVYRVKISMQTAYNQGTGPESERWDGGLRTVLAIAAAVRHCSKTFPSTHRCSVIGRVQLAPDLLDGGAV